ncbi:hypothetical protein HYC85_022432 [Camellia sinensis]|uniref:DUF2470 domain-containing protein n=1 Tax=Camellia sinensis TaxID=4442 RepID=A0A7J7GM34_CAMSI|nr:hypothetical protein HYC85_022432 [Camellia sinensis]
MKTTPLVIIGGAAPSTALRRCIAPFSRINNGFNNNNNITTIKTPQQLPLSSQFPFSLPRPLSLLAMASSSSSSSSTQSPTQNASAADSTAEFNVFQLIQAHQVRLRLQGKAARLPSVEEIRTVLDHSLRGMLSTFSQKYEGYPSGSMVDFACDAYGSPILAISSLAVHTKDLLANPKCSLLVAKDPEDRTDLIITLHGDVVSVSENDREAICTAYLARHPNAFWVDFGDFQFVRIEPKVVRYVSGVATASLGSGEFSKEEYRAAKVDPIYQFSKPIASHMNKDHAEDTKLIVQHSTSIPVIRNTPLIISFSYDKQLARADHSNKPMLSTWIKPGLVDFAHMLDLDCLGFNVKLEKLLTIFFYLRLAVKGILSSYEFPSLDVQRIERSS